MMPVDTLLLISDNVDLAMEVLIVGGSHEIAGPNRRAGIATRGNISVGVGAWIGARSVILHGVTIGAGSVLATGSVVKSSISENEICAGNPAVAIRNLSISTTPNLEENDEL